WRGTIDKPIAVGYLIRRVVVQKGSVMQKKLTISVDERVYRALYRSVGRRRISRFIENLVRPHVVKPSLVEAYAQMARDEKREAEAHEWAEGLVGDVADEPR
ncbi:MAG: hypothetical protein V2A74_03495, partial [bacterium]